MVTALLLFSSVLTKNKPDLIISFEHQSHYRSLFPLKHIHNRSFKIKELVVSGFPVQSRASPNRRMSSSNDM